MTDLLVPGLSRDRLVLPGDRAYQMLRSTYTTRHSPAMVVLPQDAEEVVAALAHARSTELAISVRSGGHGLSGSSSNDGGVVIDLSRLNEVTVLDRATRLVRVGAGARWAEVAHALAPAGLAISSGDHGNVGVGGLATAGGIGWFVRSYGLTIDHVRAVEVVLANGLVTRVDAHHEPDLFWAMRGGGQGMAIALSFDIEAVELKRVGVAQLAIEADRGGAMLRAWSDAMADAPRSLSTAMFLMPRGRSAVAQVTAVVADADEAEMVIALESLKDVGRVLNRQEQMVPYSALVSTAHLHPNVGQQPSTTTNGLFARLDARRSKALMDVVSHRAGALVQLRSVGGAVNDVEPLATAYAHRHQNVLATVTTFPPAGRTDLDAAWSKAAYLADGAYVNFESSRSERSDRRAFPGDTGRRLRELRSKFDPDGVLGQGLP